MASGSFLAREPRTTACWLPLLRQAGAALEGLAQVRRTRPCVWTRAERFRHGQRARSVSINVLASIGHGIARLQAHRRNRMAALSIPKEHVNRVLNHAAGPVTAHYDRWSYLPEGAPRSRLGGRTGPHHRQGARPRWWRCDQSTSSARNVVSSFVGLGMGTRGFVRPGGGPHLGGDDCGAWVRTNAAPATCAG